MYKISDNTLANFALKPGVGINFLHQLDNRLRFTTGAYLSPLGFKESLTVVDDLGQPAGTETINYNLNYVSLPILIGYTFFKKINLYTNIGVSPSYLLNIFYKMSIINNKVTLPVNDFNRFDISALFNIGSAFHLGEKLLLNTDINFKKGFISISDATYSPFNKSTNFGFFLSAGLKYKL